MNGWHWFWLTCASLGLLGAAIFGVFAALQWLPVWLSGPIAFVCSVLGFLFTAISGILLFSKEKKE